MTVSLVDNELLMCHKNVQGDTRALIGLMTIHVDDLKITGEQPWIKHILVLIQSEFGELKINWHVFTNCGVRHMQNTNTKEISLDQIEYAAKLKTIAHQQMTTGKP